VYVSPETEIDLRGSFFILDDPTDPNQQRQLIDRFYKKTYYQYLREMATKLNQKTLVFEDTERTKDKQMRILNRIVAYWQSYTTGIMFMAWRGYIRGRRVKRKMKADLKNVKEQLESASESVGRVASEKELALERALELNESTQREMERLQETCDRLERRNAELEDAGREMSKRFEEDARVRKLLGEIESLRKANAELRESNGGEPGSPLDASDKPQPAADGETSFVITDGADMAEMSGLREELAAAKARIAELERSTA
jgi:DNA repair exonuclease SbcCD ATPase subunit